LNHKSRLTVCELLLITKVGIKLASLYPSIQG
jgi:hypothetical protein